VLASIQPLHSGRGHPLVRQRIGSARLAIKAAYAGLEPRAQRRPGSYAEWDGDFGGGSRTGREAVRTWPDGRVTPGVTWAGKVLLADWATAHDAAPHGPSHIALVVMQLLEAIASTRPHARTAITATTTRQCFIAHSL
jgi:hypothetical protein